MPDSLVSTYSVSSTLDASGNSLMLDGSNSAIFFRPAGSGWRVRSLTVSASSRVKESLVRIFLGYVGASYEIGRTYSGSSGDTNTDPVEVADGSAIQLVWTGGDAGATVTATITVESEVPRRGFRAVS